MAQEVTALNNPSFCSVIKVDKDITYVLDNRDLDFAATVPTERSIGISRKTYSKKHPITYPAVFLPENKVNGNSNITPRYRKSILKNSPKCSSISPENISKDIRRKRPLDSPSDELKNPVPRKIRKKEIPSTKLPPSKINGRISNKNKYHKSPPNVRVPSPEVEILKFVPPSSRVLKRDVSFYGRERNKEKLFDIQKKRNSKSLPSILKPCYPSNDDVPITEADIAPVIPSNSVIPDTSVSETNQDILNSQSSNKWALSTVTSDISSVQDVETCSAKESVVEFSDKSNLFESEARVSPEKKARQKRELKSLYQNLSEIYWAREKEFKQMLGTSNHRHSERITAKAFDTGKNLRRLKAKSGNKLTLPTKTQKKALAKKNSAKLALRRAKYIRQRPRLVLKKNSKSKPSINKVNRKVTAKPTQKPIKKAKQNIRSVQVQPKVGVKAKSVIAPKKKEILESSNKHLSPVSNSKSKSVTLLETKKGSLPSALKKVKIESGTQVLPKSSCSGKVMKKFEYSNEVNVVRKKFDDNKVYSTAVKKGSKLRVEVEPLEHTSLWNNSFCEAFSKYVIEQSSTQMETKSKESIKAMFEELMDSWFHSPPENVKLLKKKKPEEEALRCSVRQSECAFRYKEIVVKKHENYMQFILVPNAVKQNSLSIEAMKELRDAFLLAKKDPNCRAVLLNSSGTFFCTGIDLSLLIGTNKRQAAEEMASTLKDLVLTLSTFTKPVVAAVNGIAVGFGVTLLTLCDVVLASDKATFCIPATRLGYLPEGAITLTLPQVVGSTVATELLLYGRRLTADQALRHGLVSEVLWHSNLMNEVIPRVQVIVSQPLQVMEATKTMVRCQLWDRLKFHMEREWRLLPPLWLDAQCQNNIKKALQTGWLYD